MLSPIVLFNVGFQNGNDYGDEYYDLALIQLPILQVTVKPIVGTNTLELDPPLESLRELVRRVFSKILDVNRKIPRFENIVFPEMAKNQKFLHCVSEEDEEVAAMINEGVAAFESNMVGPVKYLSNYEDYFYILNWEASKALDEFFKIEPFPFLKDFAKKIEMYQENKNEIIFLRRSIPLNFICLECGELNDTMYRMIEDLRLRICNYFIEQNHNHNRG